MNARYVFLTNGVGRHKERLFSFEEALRDARIAQYNLVSVSSIFPPDARLITREKGVPMLSPGEVVHVVMSRNETDENRRLLAASVGVAIPADKSRVGYLAEHHSFGETDDFAGDYTEDLAASMLATVLGVPFDPDASWDEKKQVWRLSKDIVRTQNVTQSAIGKKGVWTSVVAAAVLIP
ncbi:MAG: arginine decarboxylase, pyruvoyl-dependent [Planctomycetes bacterium]|nr:arginine decarboxylase, pyruvoyl-dependent [Planctomycetota bacterium]